MSKRVFVSRILPPEGMRKLEQLSKSGEYEIEIWEGDLPPPRDVMLKKAKGCHGMITLLTDKVDDAFLDAAGPQLKVVSNFAVGYNNIDTDAALARNIRVGHTPGVLDNAVADMALALLMSCARRISESQQYAREGKWRTWEPMGFVGCDLAGKTIGIVGMGRIGHSFAKICRSAWNMNVIYFDPFRRNEISEKELGAKRVDFDTLLKESDVVSMHCVLSKETKHMMGVKQFAKMKPTAIFINTSRGPVIDQHALEEACRKKVIFAAGIDVTEPEPALPDDPILSLPNLIVTPHIASATIDTRNAMASIAVNNLVTGIKGQSLQHEVPETRAKAKAKM